MRKVEFVIIFHMSDAQSFPLYSQLRRRVALARLQRRYRIGTNTTSYQWFARKAKARARSIIYYRNKLLVDRYGVRNYYSPSAMERCRLDAVYHVANRLYRRNSFFRWEDVVQSRIHRLNRRVWNAQDVINSRRRFRIS